MPRLALRLIGSVDRYLAQEIVVGTAFGGGPHQLVGGLDVFAVGGGVAVVRDELHGLAEVISTDRRSLCEAKSLEW